ncbi:MAG: Hsp20/alpha crystallin family protein [Armatimonadota bacterium]|nr:Hsp20/alpha crystallin family protein [Armatimonadota bacterium]MDR7436959.1 Hsp20/alpha crystallin family protein [Armatimonadota bacterium]MDR7472267.1 Hsp20/alpha crystallin family protein [Armatimonadota bacterium]MDR7508356.1 Hsp20/alpha crystallin family protein [Armatimonadota bacterium]
MALLRIRRGERLWDPWRELEELRREVERLWGVGRTGRRSTPEAEALVPAVDLYDAGDSLVARVDLPGVRPEDVEVTVDEGRLLSVRASRKADDVREDAYLCCERPAGRFARTIELPVEVDADRVKASLKMGVLEIVLPKSREPAPRKIAVAVEQ